MCDLGPRPRRPYLVITCESTAWNPFFLWFLGSLLPRVFNLGCHVLSCCLLVPYPRGPFLIVWVTFFFWKIIFIPVQIPKMKCTVLLKSETTPFSLPNISHFLRPWSSSHSQIFLISFLSSIELQPQPQPFANRNPQSAPEITIHNP